jgi:hypothetical protein
MTADEHATIAALFDALTTAPLQSFPGRGVKLVAPNDHGVYIIYSPDNDALHVGQTPRGRNGLRQRLGNHLRTNSSFTRQSLRGRRLTTQGWLQLSMPCRR